MGCSGRLKEYVLVAVVALVAPATAGGRDVVREGPCSGTADWKLKLSPEDGRIEVEYEVDSNVNGQTWRVRLFKDGDRIFRGTRQTHGPSGSFEPSRHPESGWLGQIPSASRQRRQWSNLRGKGDLLEPSREIAVRGDAHEITVVFSSPKNVDLADRRSAIA